MITLELIVRSKLIRSEFEIGWFPAVDWRLFSIEILKYCPDIKSFYVFDIGILAFSITWSLDWWDKQGE